MTEDEWQKLYDNFDTTWLLESVEDIDKVNAAFGRSELRQDLEELHTLATAVVNKADTANAEEMFELADDIELQISDIIDALENIQETMNKLITLEPDLEVDEELEFIE